MTATIRSANRSFAAELWEAAGPVFAAILEQPFLAGVVDGSLPVDRFRYYLLQDALYIGESPRATALTAASAPRGADAAALLSRATTILQADQTVHEELRGSFGLSRADVEITAQSPSTTAYINYLLAHTARGSFLEAMAALLPCPWVYREVGRALAPNRAPDSPYGGWLDTYAGEEFGVGVDGLLAILDEAARGTEGDERRRLSSIFRRGVQYEWMFWNAAWVLEAWPV